MKYKILRTDKTEEQLREIIFYIAIKYLNKIETAINRLRVFPELKVFLDIQFKKSKSIE